MAEYEVIVVGAGVIGSATAYYLAKQGKKCLLLEQFSLLHDKASSYGQSRAAKKAYGEPHYAAMMKEAYTMWDTLEQESETKIMKQCGMLTFGIEGSEPMKKCERVLREVGGKYEVLSPTELQTCYPMVKFDPSHNGIVDKEGRVLLANKCHTAFQELYKRFGGKIQEEEKVTEVTPGQKICVTTDKGQYSCDSLVLTPGPWAQKLLTTLQLQLPIKLVCISASYWKVKEGEEGRYACSELPVFFTPHGTTDKHGKTHGMLGFPADEYPDKIKVTTSSGQDIDPDLWNLDPDYQEDIEVMKSFIKDHFPDVETTPSSVEKGIVSLTPDMELIVDCHPSWSNIVIGAGMSGHGYKLAPVVGKILGQLATGVTPDYNISPLSLSRFENKTQTQT